MEKQRGQALPRPRGPGVFHGNVHRARPASAPLQCPAGLLHVSESHHGRPVPDTQPSARAGGTEGGTALRDSQPLGVRTTGGPGHLLGGSWNSGRGDSWVWGSSLQK